MAIRNRGGSSFFSNQKHKKNKKEDFSLLPTSLLRSLTTTPSINIPFFRSPHHRHHRHWLPLNRDSDHQTVTTTTKQGQRPEGGSDLEKEKGFLWWETSFQRSHRSVSIFWVLFSQLETGKRPFYDCMLLLKPDVKKEPLKDLVARVGKHVYSKNGVLTDVKSFGMVQLGYGIKKLDGRYYKGQLMQMTMMTTPNINKELHYLNKEDRLLRWLLVKHRDLNYGLEFLHENEEEFKFSQGSLYDDDSEEDDDAEEASKNNDRL